MLIVIAVVVVALVIALTFTGVTQIEDEDYFLDRDINSDTNKGFNFDYADEEQLEEQKYGRRSTTKNITNSR